MSRSPSIFTDTSEDRSLLLPGKMKVPAPSSAFSDTWQEGLGCPFHLDRVEVEASHVAFAGMGGDGARFFLWHWASQWSSSKHFLS